MGRPLQVIGDRNSQDSHNWDRIDTDDNGRRILISRHYQLQCLVVSKQLQVDIKRQLLKHVTEQNRTIIVL